jgi:hypothetical protein
VDAYVHGFIRELEVYHGGARLDLGRVGGIGYGRRVDSEARYVEARPKEVEVDEGRLSGISVQTSRQVNDAVFGT